MREGIGVGNRVTGLSGMDIEGMVSSLMKVETAKVDKLYKQRTTLLWKQEAYVKMSSQLQSFQSKYLDITKAFNFKTSALYNKRAFSITAGGVASSNITVKNTTLTKNVDHKITVEQLAQKQKMVGYGSNGDAYAKKMYSKTIDFDGLREGSSLTLTLDGKKETIELDADVISDIKSATGSKAKAEVLADYLDEKFYAKFGDGLTANKAKVKISATDDGLLKFETEVGRTLTASSYNNYQASTPYFEYDKDNIENELKFTVGSKTITVSTIDTETNEKYDTAAKLAEAINKKLVAEGISTDDFAASASGSYVRFTAKSETDEFKFKEITTGDKKLTANEDGSVTEFTLYGKKDSAMGITAGMSTDSTTTMTVGSAFANVNFNELTINGKTFASLGITDPNMSMDKMISIINEKTNVNLSYNAITGTFTMESKESGKNNGFTLNEKALEAFGFNSIYEYRSVTEEVDDGAGGTTTVTKTVRTDNVKDSEKNRIVNAQDAVFWLDGVKTSRTSNDITIGELNITLNKASAEEITIKSSSDTEALANTIKEFINSYNELLKTFTDSYNEKKAKNGSYAYYEPLTDDEKSAMSDKDVTLWEEQAKKGLLSRDSTVGRMVDALRSAMTEEVLLPGINATTGRQNSISLASIGISSTDWKDLGQLSIDEEKLMKALEERPDDVMALFSNESRLTYGATNRQQRFKENGLAYRLDDAIKDATNSRPNAKGLYGWFVELVGSANTKINDNQMTKSIKEINDKIWDLEQLNLSKENNYYNMFSKMEQAMTKAQNQMSMAGLSGGA